MECTIQPEDKQDLIDLTEILKGENVPGWKKLVLLGYMRGRADEIMLGEKVQQQ